MDSAFGVARDVLRAEDEEVRDGLIEAAIFIRFLSITERRDRGGLPRCTVLVTKFFASHFERSSTTVVFPAPSPPTTAMRTPAALRRLGNPGLRLNSCR